MFVVNLVYKADLKIVDQFLEGHRSFLDECYKKGYFLASGPKEPRTGGVIIALMNDQTQLEEILAQDPFYINGVAQFEITKFMPVKYHSSIADLV